MRFKSKQLSSLKLVLFGVFVVLSMLIWLGPNLASYREKPSSIFKAVQVEPPDPVKGAERLNCSSSCNKIPREIAQAIIHYKTSKIIPQQTLEEISVTSAVLEKKSPCNFLVFGLGHDSLMWSTLNYGGRTIFLEEDKSWIAQIKRRFPGLESYHVTYNGNLTQADVLMEIGKGPECTAISDVRYSMCPLVIQNLPAEVYDTTWDLIMVDAPTGYHKDAPGRISAIYTAGLMARTRPDGGKTDVFVHDVNREVEDKFSKAFLCDAYVKAEEGRLRHFTIPAFKDGPDRPLCPKYFFL